MLWCSAILGADSDQRLHQKQRVIVHDGNPFCLCARQGAWGVVGNVFTYYIQMDYNSSVGALQIKDIDPRNKQGGAHENLCGRFNCTIACCD